MWCISRLAFSRLHHYREMCVVWVAVFSFSLSLSTELKEAFNGGEERGNLMSVLC
jgi:hypothetical protein